MRLLLVVLLFTLSCLKEEAPSSGNLSANAKTKWLSSDFPLTIKMSNDFTLSEQTSMNSMANEWETAVNNEINFFSTGLTTNISYTSMDDYYDSEYGVYKTFVRMTGLPSSALAVTQIYGFQKGSYIEIVHSDIIVNYYDFDFSNDFSFGTYDLPTVILHEMGHFLGLYHIQDYSIDSVMLPSISQLTIARSTYAIDKSSIKSNYGLTGGGSAVIASNISSGNPGTREEVSIIDSGKPVRIMLELHADGSCVHKKNGKIIHNHQVNLSKKP